MRCWLYFKSPKRTRLNDARALTDLDLTDTLLTKTLGSAKDNQHVYGRKTPPTVIFPTIIDTNICLADESAGLNIGSAILCIGWNKRELPVWHHRKPPSKPTSILSQLGGAVATLFKCASQNRSPIQQCQTRWGMIRPITDGTQKQATKPSAESEAKKEQWSGIFTIDHRLETDFLKHFNHREHPVNF